MTQFHCYLLLGEKYQAAVCELDRVAAGDDVALHSALTCCREYLGGESFLRWHSAPIRGPYLLKDWTDLLDNLPSRASAEVAKRIAEIFLPASCMPEYQIAHSYGQEQSPNLVCLADGDGGFYEVLAKLDPWFNNLIFERFAETAKYAVGNAMIVLDRSDLARLEQSIAKVSDELCETAWAPQWCRVARDRLASLVGRCLAVEDGLLAVCETG